MEKKSFKPVIGVVGGIGSGKTTAAEIFHESGAAVINADELGHQSLENKDVKAKITACFPGAVQRDGMVNRKVISQKVFCDAMELKKLNSIVQPLITARICELIAEYQKKPHVKAIILDAAILFEAGWDKFCDEVVFVDCDDEIRYQRVHESRGWDKKKWVLREKSQISLDKKRKVCKHIIVNRSSVSHLRDQVRKLYPRLVH